MASTKMFTGMNEGKPSSKVMAPPGGASSNIFGTEPAYTRQGGDCAPKEAAQSRDTKNRLFGDDSPAPAAAASAEPAPQERAPPAGVNTHAGKRNHVTYDKPDEGDSGIITACRKRFFKNEGRDGEEEEESEEERKKREEEERKKALEEAALSRQKARAARGAYNPITGEDYPDQTKEQPATRVRQPPGGRSSGPLW